MPTPDDQRQRGGQTQMSQTRVGPSAQQSATASPFAGGGVGGQTPSQLQIGQQAQIKDPGTALFEAISGTAQGVQSGIKNYSDYYDMVSDIEYAEFETQFAQQSEAVNGDSRKMAAWMENNTYKPNRRTARRYWNLHADVNGKAYADDQEDWLFEFNKRIAPLQANDQLNEIEQALKTLDPDSPSYRTLELEQIKLSGTVADNARMLTVSGMNAQATMQNEALVGAIKGAHGEKYDMFMSTEIFKQLMIAQSFGLVKINAGDGETAANVIIGQGENQTIIPFDAINPSTMGPIIDRIGNRAQEQGVDVFRAYFKAANLPRGLLGNQTRVNTTPAEKAQQSANLQAALLGDNPRSLLALAAEYNPSNPQEEVGNVLDTIFKVTNPENFGNMSTEDLMRAVDSINGFRSILDPENTEAFGLLSMGPNDTPESIRSLYAGQDDNLIQRRQVITNEILSRGIGESVRLGAEVALSGAEMAQVSARNVAKLQPLIASSVGDMEVIFVDGTTAEIERVSAEDITEFNTAGKIMAGIVYNQEEINAALPAGIEGSDKRNYVPETVLGIQAIVQRTNQIGKLIAGETNVTPELTNDFLTRLNKRAQQDPEGSAKTLRSAIIANRNRTTTLLDSSADTVESIRQFSSYLPGYDTQDDFTSESQARTVLYDLYRNGSKEDKEAILKVVNPGDRNSVNFAFEVGVGMGVGEDFDSRTAVEMFAAINSNPNYGAVGQFVDQYLETMDSSVDSRRSFVKDDYAQLDEMLRTEYETMFPNGVDNPGLFDGYRIARLQQLKVAELALSANRNSSLYAANADTPRQTMERLMRAASETPFAMRGMSNPGALPGPTNEMTSPAFQALGDLDARLDRGSNPSQLKGLTVRVLAPIASAQLEEALGKNDTETLSEVFSIAASSDKIETKQRKLGALLKDKMEGIRGARPAFFARALLREIDNSPNLRFTPNFGQTDNRMHSDGEGVPIGQTTSVYYQYDIDLSKFKMEPGTADAVRRALGRGEIQRLGVVSEGLEYTPLRDNAAAPVEEKAYEAMLSGVSDIPGLQGQNEATKSALTDELRDAEAKLAEFMTQNMSKEAKARGEARAKREIDRIKNELKKY